jgi:ABC-type dipeptide/oligopeptide/nickel transport system ATPase component
MGKQFWLMHGRYTVHSPLYVAMVGEAGSGKSTAKKDAKTLFKNNLSGG